MCKRIGVEWWCGCKWRGWAPYYEQPSCTRIGKDCLATDQEEPLSPSSKVGIWKTEQNNKRQVFVRPSWCCSPQCCQRALQRSADQQNALEEHIRDATKVSYRREVTHHLTGCLPHFSFGLGGINSMRGAEYKVQDTKIEYELRLLLDPTAKEISDYVHYTRIYEKAIEKSEFSLDVKRTPVHHHEYIRSYLLLWLKQMYGKDEPSHRLLEAQRDTDNEPFPQMRGSYASRLTGLLSPHNTYTPTQIYVFQPYENEITPPGAAEELTTNLPSEWTPGPSVFQRNRPWEL